MRAVYSNKQGLSLTVAIKKTTNAPSRCPVDGSIKIKEIGHSYLVENRCLEALRFFGYNSVGKVAIFGSARAANIAKSFLKTAGVEVVCFVDDYNIGQVGNTLVVRWSDFVISYQSLCSHLVKGPMQSGEFVGRYGLLIPILEISPDWL